MTEISNKIKEILKSLPKSPGVYKMKNGEGKILYVGKAKNLSNRVKSYFSKSSKHSVRIGNLVKQIEDIGYIEVETDLEAYILETNLIKELRPKYNILMKDDKGFVYVKVTVNEDFPRIFVTRKVENDGARYFGPKTASSRTYKTLKVLKKLFPYRHCQLDIDYLGFDDKKLEHKVKVSNKVIKYPCLDYHIKRCIAPCIGKCSPQEYKEIVDEVVTFLEGKHDFLLKRLNEKMQQLAIDKKFEQAARMRDKLKAVESIVESQNINDPEREDMDILSFAKAMDKICFNLFMIRGGRIIDQQNFQMSAQDFDLDNEQDMSEIVRAFVYQYYSNTGDFPKEFIIPGKVEDKETLIEWLKVKSGFKMKILVPSRGKKKRLLDLSKKNALSYAKQLSVKWMSESNTDEVLGELQSELSLSKLPKRIECYDISHLGGTLTVASMVVFENGKPLKKDYRHFKLKDFGVGNPDDFESMREVIGRRLKRLQLAENQKPELKDEFEFRSSKKKDREILKIDDKKGLYVLAKDDKLLACGRVTKGEKEFFLTELWRDKNLKDNDFKAFIWKVIEKVTKSKLYVVYEKDENILKEIGFRYLKIIPSKVKELDSYEKKLKVMSIELAKISTGSFAKRPDLILIDGGKGQLYAAIEIMKNLGVDVEMASLAKKEEEIFRPGVKESVLLKRNSEALFLVQRIRDEAHRFAVEYNRNLRGKKVKKSILDTIPGIGPKTRQKLLKEFGSVEKMKKVSEKDLAKIVGLKTAKVIKAGIK